MADQRIVDFVKPRWCTIRLATAHDQHLAINETFGTFAAFRESNPTGNKWFHFLIMPRDVDSGQFWLFSKAAQGGSGELVSAPDGARDLRQERLTGELWQCFAITPLASYDRDRMVRLTCVRDGRVVSTRWTGRRFSGTSPKATISRSFTSATRTDPDADGPRDRGHQRQHGPRSLEGRRLQRHAGGGGDAATRGVDATDPFPFVDDTYPLGWRMRKSPYYLLTRRCFWKKVKAKSSPPPARRSRS